MRSGRILVNLGLVAAAAGGLLGPFDPFPVGLLTMIVSLEAIFLATFVMISQNRLAAVADHRADLDYQVNVKAEAEIARAAPARPGSGRGSRCGPADCPAGPTAAAPTGHSSNPADSGRTAVDDPGARPRLVPGLGAELLPWRTVEPLRGVHQPPQTKLAMGQE